MAEHHKVPQAIEKDITGFDASKLKHADTQEKNVLPSTEEISHEKTLQNIEGFDKTNLKHTETEVKTVLPDSEVITQEKTIQNIESFDKKNLKHAETEVKTSLPDKNGWTFSKMSHHYMTPSRAQSLPHTKTIHISPVINQEKTIQNIEGFDKSNLKRASTEVKNPLPDKNTIEQEKRLSGCS